MSIAPEVRDWLDRKTILADGALSPADAWEVREVLASLDAIFTAVPAGDLDTGRVDPREAVTAAMLRSVCKSSTGEIATLLGKSRSTIQNRWRWHLRALDERPGYAAYCRDVVTSLVAAREKPISS